jgi:hypothetical protein
VLLAGTLVASLVAAGFALTMNLGITPATVPAPPAITGRTGSAQPVVHARASTLHKNAMNPPVGLGSTRTVVLPGPGPSPTPGPAESTRAPGSGQPTVEGTELRDADD